MFNRLLDRVRSEASGERALQSVRVLANFHRVQASPGYDRAAAWLAEAFESCGLEVEIEAVPGDGQSRYLGQLMPEGWECTGGLATVVEGREREPLCDVTANPLSIIQRSAPAHGRFHLVALADGAEERDFDGLDLKDAVVLSRGQPHRLHATAVMKRGAAGLLFDGRRFLQPVRDRFDDPDAVTYASFWWNGEEPRGWGLVVSPRQGERLRERLGAGATLSLEVEIESHRFPTTIPLVSARIPGRLPSDVLVLAHLCHPRPSANDNASGVAANLETARVLALLRARGELPDTGHGIRFLAMPELTGTHAWLGCDSRRAELTVAAFNLYMAGEDPNPCGRTLAIEHPPCFAASFAEELLGRIREDAVDWVTSYSGPGHYAMTRMAEVPFSGGSDHMVLVDPAVGVPCPMLIQWPDRFYHSSHDTPDKCDSRSLELAVRCAATYAGWIAGAGEPELRWLVEAVTRGAQRRILRALDRPEPERELRRERIRFRSALESLGRLGYERDAIEGAATRLATFMSRETPPIPAEPPTATSPESPRPRRRLAAPLHYHRHLIEGYATLDDDDRERWRRLEERIPGGSTLFDLAWFACDGRRSIQDIEHLVWIETGWHEAEAIREFFDLTSRLNLAEWLAPEEAAWSSSERGTGTP